MNSNRLAMFYSTTGVTAAGISREQQAKMMQQQQQQMLRAQQQQQMRPPPPEYKARFVGAVGGVGPAMGARRPAGPAPRPFVHPRQYSPEWRHVLMQQQQQTRQQFPHHHQGTPRYSVRKENRRGGRVLQCLITEYVREGIGIVSNAGSSLLARLLVVVSRYMFLVENQIKSYTVGLSS